MTQAEISDDFSSWLDAQEKAAHQAIERTHGQARAWLRGEPTSETTPAATASPAASADPAASAAASAPTVPGTSAVRPPSADPVAPEPDTESDTEPVAAGTAVEPAADGRHRDDDEAPPRAVGE